MRGIDTGTDRPTESSGGATATASSAPPPAGGSPRSGSPPRARRTSTGRNSIRRAVVKEGKSQSDRRETRMSGTTEKAILAGGCFWGMQDLFRREPGVIATRVGYSGGDVPNATYRNHGTHAEAIEVVFDPEQTSFR